MAAQGWGRAQIESGRVKTAMKNRRSIRLTDYDYTWPGYYFVTISTRNKSPIFGALEGEKVRLNENGRIDYRCWQSLPEHFEHLELDAFIVMPNHVHGIIVIQETFAGDSPNHGRHESRLVGAQHAAPVRLKAAVAPNSLGAIIRSFKSAVTKDINRLGDSQIKIWLRNYYEHIIRDDQDLENIRRYVLYNAAK
jgi:putative transposase